MLRAGRELLRSLEVIGLSKLTNALACFDTNLIVKGVFNA